MSGKKSLTKQRAWHKHASREGVRKESEHVNILKMDSVHWQVRLRGPAAATNFSLGDYRSALADFHRKHQVTIPTLYPLPACLITAPQHPQKLLVRVPERSWRHCD